MAQKKRHHASKRARRDEHMGMERYERGPVNHHPDKFNDEFRHDRDMSFGAMGFDERIARAANRNEFYAGMEPRRRQELEDAGMIREDHRAIANLPQEVMIKAYPKTGPYMPEGIDDSIRGVDYQMDYDDSKRQDHWYPKKV